MKIYILKTPEVLRPKSQKFNYPKHNSDYGVEQDFYDFLQANQENLTNSPIEADWHYLPVYWTRWHLNHDYGNLGLQELQRYVDEVILEDSKTFTICQYDDGPIIDLGKTVQFLSSRKTLNGIDIPLLCKNHTRPWFTQKKRYLASFVGRIKTHPIRLQMYKELKDSEAIFIQDGNMPTRKFVRLLLQSYLALAPRGYGGSSFRLFEAMQLGVAPILLGDLDTRPFKKFLPWDEVSKYVKNIPELIDFLNQKSKSELLIMGEKSEILFANNLTYQKWCPFVFKELESIGG